jgi:phosphoribosyl-AMP cyclohydrolase
MKAIRTMIELNFSKSEDGLIPAIAQDWKTGEILMLAYINEDSWKFSLETGNATYWSRSRQKLWKKGESSGNVQKIKEILVDCDEDTVVFKIDQIGDAACHLGYRSCFFRKANLEKNELEVVGELVFDPTEVYK